jgi:hypothetical protein
MRTGQHVAQKLIASHLACGEMTAGSEIGLRIDQTLTQDACAVPNPAHGLTWWFTLVARAHPPRLPVHGPGGRLAGAAGAQ